MNGLIPDYLDYYNMLEQYQRAQLFFAAIRLDIFSYLNEWTDAHGAALQSGYDENALKHCLLALSALDLIEKEGETYRNTPAAKKYLTKESPNYLGETLLFRESMTSLADMDALVTGAKKGEAKYDFAKLAEVTVPEMYATGRVSLFLSEMDRIFPNRDDSVNILDLGGGSGVLAMEFAKQFPHSSAVVFEHPDVTPVSRKILREHGAPDRVRVVEGDFNTDALGGPYDLMIASGILDFSTNGLSDFILKISEALSKNGYLLLIGQFADDLGQSSRRTISWLSGYLNGLPLPPSGEDVRRALLNAGLSKLREVKAGRFHGQIYQKEEVRDGQFAKRSD